MRKVILLLCFFAVTPCVLFASIVLFAYQEYSLQKNHQLSLFQSLPTTTFTYAALPSVQTQFDSAIGIADVRIEKLKRFFHIYGSVLEQYAGTIILAADSNHIDYRLIPSIAMQESEGCERIIPNSHNCWGFGIYTKHIITFKNYDDAINTISSYIAKNYVEKGLNTPEEIGTLYNPADTNAWSDKVIYFMNQIQNTL